MATCKQFYNAGKAQPGGAGKIYEATWKVLFEAYERDPILGGLARGVFRIMNAEAALLSENVEVDAKPEMSKVVARIYRIVRSKARELTLKKEMSLPPAPLGTLHPARLSEMAEAADTINFISLGANLCEETQKTYLSVLMSTLKTEQRNILSWAEGLARHVDIVPGQIDLLEIPYEHQCTHLPNMLGLLTNLTILDVKGIDVDEHTDGQTEFGWGSSSWLANLPESIQACAQLARVSASHNCFTELPASLFNCKNLVCLEFRNNFIQSVPEAIGDLPYLYTLDLCGNSITRLPSTLGRLKSLCYLNLSQNPFLRCLPEEIGGLAGLMDFWLDHCPKLTAIPSSIGELSQLRLLSLSECGLKYLPREVSKCTRLKHLNLSGCTAFTMHKDEVLKITPWLEPFSVISTKAQALDVLKYGLKTTYGLEAAVILPDHVFFSTQLQMPVSEAEPNGKDEKKEASETGAAPSGPKRQRTEERKTR